MCGHANKKRRAGRSHVFSAAGDKTPAPQCWSAGLVLSFLIMAAVWGFSPSPAGAGEGLSWKKGDQWTVRAVYKTPPPGQGWSAPVYWRYVVTAIEAMDGQPCFRVQIGTKTQEVDSILWVDHKTYALIAVQTLRQGRGRAVAAIRRLDQPAPVRTRYTITPHDWPVFPLEPGADKTYTAERRVSEDLIAVEQIRQQAAMVAADDTIPDAPEAFAAAGARLLKVVCTGKNERPLFVQYYAPDQPWPVYGYNDDMRYWLVTP